jgi:hypothetical protein
MKKITPDPHLLPVSVSIEIPKKNIKIDNMYLKQYQTAYDLKDLVYNYFE